METRSIPGRENWAFFTMADTCLLKAVLRTLEPSFETGRAEDAFIRPNLLYKKVRSRLQIPLCQGPGGCDQGWRERNAQFIRGEEPLGITEADIVADTLRLKITFWDEDGECIQCTSGPNPKQHIYLRYSEKTKQFHRIAYTKGTGMYEMVFEP